MIEYRAALIRDTDAVAKLDGNGVSPEGSWANSYSGDSLDVVLLSNESLAAQIHFQRSGLRVLSDLDLHSDSDYELMEVGGSVVLSIKALNIYLQVSLISR